MDMLHKQHNRFQLKTEDAYVRFFFITSYETFIFTDYFILCPLSPQISSMLFYPVILTTALYSQGKTF